MKQTAVEWLASQLESITTDLFEQAKEMEKEQIIEFANDYGFEICGYDYEKAEKHYHETFKSE